MMKISVVLATYNRLEILKQSLESLFNQDFGDIGDSLGRIKGSSDLPSKSDKNLSDVKYKVIPNNQYEVLVIDDGSSDGTREYLEELCEADLPIPFRYHTQENAGPAKARNWGIFNAMGEYVAFTDDDCVPPEDWLSKIVDAFDRYPNVVGVSGYQEADDTTLGNNIYAQFEKYANIGEFMEDQQKEHVGSKDFLGGATNNVAYKREILLKTNGFDESFPFPASEDADLKERIVADGSEMVHIPVKVNHKQQFGFKRLMRQAYVRGVGSRHFNIKHNKPISVFRFTLSVGKHTLRLSRLLLTRYWYLFGLVTLYQLQFMCGVIDYPRVIKSRA